MDKLALLEYDYTSPAVIERDHEHLDVKFPEIAVYAFTGDTVDEYAKEHNAEQIAFFDSITKPFPVYQINHNGVDICFMQAPVGAAHAVQIMDWLTGYGVKKIISTGSCGILQDYPKGTFLIPFKAVREEGASFHYLPPSRYVELNKQMVQKIEEYFASRNIPYETCLAWTTDGFFRETVDKVNARKKEGCGTVDMECSALAACAEFRGVEFGQFFFSADSLHDLDNYDERDWGASSTMPALLLALDMAASLGE